MTILVVSQYQSTTTYYDTNGVAYTLDNTNYTATVSDGNRDNYYYTSSSVNGYTSSYSVTLPDAVSYGNQNYAVTSVSSLAFSGCTGLTSVSMPAVTSVSSLAFSGCTGLTSVSMPAVTSVSSYAFSGCTGLTTVSMPAVTSIGSNAFELCDNMNNVTSYIYSNELTSVYSNANATLYIVSTNTTYFTTSANACVYKILTEGTGSNAGTVSVFTCSSSLSGSLTLNNVTHSNTSYTITDIGYNALSNLINLTSVSMPAVTSIGSNAFNGCKGLTSVSMPAVTSVGSIAFYVCTGLTTVSMPAVTSIGSNAFNGCTGLTTVSMPAVTSIGSGAFNGCSGLTNVTSYIYSDELTSVYSNANATLYIVSTNTTYFTTSANACVYKILTEGSGSNAGTVSVFTCYSSGSLTLNNVTHSSKSYTITEIDSSALANLISLTSVSMPNVTSVGSLAFNGCTGLTSVSMPVVTSIGSYAFYGCNNLSSVYFQGDYNASFFNNSQFYSIAFNATAYYLAGNTTWPNTAPAGFAYIQSYSLTTTASICFPARTPVLTNQGYVSIEQIDPAIHTVRNKPVIAVTQTVSDEKHLIRIAKNALGNNYPTKTTLISQNHELMFMGQMIKAKDLVGLVDNVTRVPYNGEPLYNVLLDTHDKMQVNNLIVETLHPEHKVAQLYHLLNLVKPEERDQVIALYNQLERQHKKSLTK